MDLSSPRVKNEEKLAICKKNFFMGLALLPWLWFINGVWFFREAFFKEPFDQQPMIRRFEILSNSLDPPYFFIRYVMLSIIGATIWAAGITAWNCIFQMKRLEWGELGDNLSAYIPTG